MGKLVGYHGFAGEGRAFLVNNYGEVCDHDPFNWLVSTYTGENYKKVCYDLDSFVAVVLRMAGVSREDGDRLFHHGKLGRGEWALTYYPNKFFGVGKGWERDRPYAAFYDIGQYIDDLTLDFPQDAEHWTAVAKQARDTGAEVSRTLYELGLNGDTLTSPIRSLELSVLGRLDLPNHMDCPAEVNELALACCKGDLVESYRQGHFHNCLDLDLSGAYTSFLANLYDTRRGEWVEGERRENALYGFAEGEITTYARLHPFVFKGADGENLTPNGTWPTTLSMASLDFLRQYPEEGSFEITGKQWWWIPTGKYFKGELVTTKQNQPMKGIVNYLYNRRTRPDTTPMGNKLLKRCSNGLWGRTLSRVIKGGQKDPFFPVWGAYTEELVRIEVVRFCLENDFMPISIAVDGVITDKQIQYSDSKGLGKWRLSHSGDCLVVGSGVVAMQNKEGRGDFSVGYDWLRAAIEAAPDSSEYALRKVTCCTLGKALITDWENLGTLDESHKTVYVGQEDKRLYIDNPTCGRDLLENQYESEALDIATAMA